MKQKDTLIKVMRYIKRYRGYLWFSIFLAFLTVLATLYVPILIGDTIDFIIGANNVTFSVVFSKLKIMAIVVIITVFMQWFQNLCNNKITYHVIQDIRNEAFQKIEVLPLKYIDTHVYGDIVSRVIADVDQFADGLLMGFTQLFTGVLTIIGTLFFMFTVNLKITLVVLILTPISLFVAKFIVESTYKMFKMQSITRGEQTALIDEMIGGQKVVQAFGYEQEALRRFDEINGKLEKYSMRATFYSSLTNPCTRFVNSLVYAAVGIIGALACVKGTLSVGQLSCFLTYANQYTKPFNEISGVITEFQNALACAGRLFELLEQPDQSPDLLPLEEVTTFNGHVDLEHVYFSYTADKKLIEDFNLNVLPGQKIAIVGPTGCGKTTLINLLMRFYEVNNGEIKVSGKRIAHMTRANVREGYGMVLQETWLRTGTIAENIKISKPEATDEEMIEAAKAAYAHSFIKRMPQGYQTIVSDEGSSLSQGQKQLLCIARVMLSLPPMLILDEATSSIDTRTEAKIQAAFNKMMEGRTSFIVAHRLSTIQNADMILVMKDGHIIEQGNHETLLKQNGFYATLYQSQFAH